MNSCPDAVAGAIHALEARHGAGVVLGGIDHAMHVAPAMAEGWRGIRRGLAQSYVDLETAVPRRSEVSC